MSHPQAPQPAPKQFWEEGFVPAAIDNALVTSVTGALGQAVQAGTQVIGDLIPSLTIPGINTTPTTAGGSTGGGIFPLPSQITIPGTSITIGAGGGGAPGTSGTVPVPTAPAGGTAPPLTGDLVKDIENAALAAAKSSTSALLPSIQSAVEAKVAGAVQSEVGAFIKHLGGSAEPAVPDLNDFTKADARSRAFRTLLIGLALSALWGLVNVAGNLLTVDWTNKDALPQVISIAVTAVVGGVTAYIARVLKEPAHITNATIIPNTSTG